MISLPPLAVLGFLELLLLLAALAGWLAWRVWLRGAGPMADAGEEQVAAGAHPHGARLDVGNYLAEELERTRARLHNPVPPADVPPAWLALRADYLQLEKDFAAHEHREEQAWGPLEERLCELLQRLAPPSPEPPAASAHDGRQVQDLLSDQLTHIGDLHGFLKEVVVHPEKAEELEQRIERMNRVNQELAGCVAVLEGENERLWRQIEGVSPASDAPAAAPVPEAGADAAGNAPPAAEKGGAPASKSAAAEPPAPRPDVGADPPPPVADKSGAPGADPGAASAPKSAAAEPSAPRPDAGADPSPAAAAKSTAAPGADPGAAPVPKSAAAEPSAPRPDAGADPSPAAAAKSTAAPGADPDAASAPKSAAAESPASRPDAGADASAPAGDGAREASAADPAAPPPLPPKSAF